MKWQQKTTVCFWDFLDMIMTFCGILLPDSFFGEVSEKKISSGVSTFQRIRDVEFTRKNRHVSTSRLPKVKHHCGVVHPVLFLKITKPCSPFLEATKTKKTLWFSKFRWLEVVKACRSLREYDPPLPPTQKKSSICFAFYLFLKDFKVQLFLTLAKNNLNKLMIGIEIPSNLWCLITFQERPTPGSCVQMMMMMIHRTSALASSCCDFQHANAWGKSGEEVRNKTRQYGCFQK